MSIVSLKQDGNDKFVCGDFSPLFKQNDMNIWNKQALS